jgi:hypothetical protein
VPIRIKCRDKPRDKAHPTEDTGLSAPNRTPLPGREGRVKGRILRNSPLTLPSLPQRRRVVTGTLSAPRADDPEACYADRKPKLRMLCGSG